MKKKIYEAPEILALNLTINKYIASPESWGVKDDNVDGSIDIGEDNGTDPDAKKNDSDWDSSLW